MCILQVRGRYGAQGTLGTGQVRCKRYARYNLGYVQGCVGYTSGVRWVRFKGYAGYAVKVRWVRFKCTLGTLYRYHGDASNTGRV